MVAITVKGTGLISTRTYVKEKHPERYKDWLKSLPNESHTVYSGVIDSSAWFDVKTFYYVPLKCIADIFFGGNEPKAAIEVGRFGADFALKGVYKVFLSDSNPKILVKAAQRVFSTYHRPVIINIEEVSDNSFTFVATKLYPPSEILDYRMIGWCERALELAHCKNISYKTLPSPTPSDFSVKFSWETLL